MKIKKHLQLKMYMQIQIRTWSKYNIHSKCKCECFFYVKKKSFICRTRLYLYKKPITTRGNRYSFVTIFLPLSKRNS